MAKRNQNEVRPEDSLTFAGLETCDTDRQIALGVAQAEELTARLRSTRGDISAKAGRMERESPLFFGTGDSPLLW
jgi:hypothetical protein